MDFERAPHHRCRYMVVNGACKHKDMAHFEEEMAKFGGDVSMEYCDDLALLALQVSGVRQRPQLSIGADVALTAPLKRERTDVSFTQTRLPAIRKPALPPDTPSPGPGCRCHGSKAGAVGCGPFEDGLYDWVGHNVGGH